MPETATASGHDAALRYIRRDMKRVEGWLHPLTAEIIAAVGQAQLGNGLDGAVGEIGVHHGKLWLVLDHLARDGDARFAIDVFENEELNVDGSGKGDRARFEANRAAYGARHGTVRIIARSSDEVRPEELSGAVGPVRLFSIDGGHTDALTLNDLRLAEAVLAPGGAVFLDDVFNPMWPGVVTGLAHYVLGGGGLVPVAICPGKVVLAHPGTRCGELLEHSFTGALVGRRPFFGAEVPVFVPSIEFARRAKSIVGGTPLEPLARKVHRIFFS